MSPLPSEPRSAIDIKCGIESEAEVVYAEHCEAEQATDRRHDLSPDEWFHHAEPER